MAPSPKAVRLLRDRGCKDHRILRRVPDDGRHPGSFRACSFHEEHRRAVSAVLRSPDPRQPSSHARKRGQDAAPVKTGEAGGASRIATGVSEARSHTAPWEDNAHAAALEAESARVHSPRVVRRPAEAVPGVVKTPGPPVFHCAEPKTPRGVHASREAHGAGNERGAGARDSIGWQISVRRIARLLCRSIARSLGSKRALAGRKSAAPPDAERGWVEGETVRLVRGIPQDSTDQGMQVSACTLEYDGRRSRASARRALTGSPSQSPSAPRSTCAVHGPQGSVPAAQHIGRIRNPTRVCLGVTTRTSEVGTVR